VLPDRWELWGLKSIVLNLLADLPPDLILETRRYPAGSDYPLDLELQLIRSRATTLQLTWSESEIKLSSEFQTVTCALMAVLADLLFDYLNVGSEFILATAPEKRSLVWIFVVSLGSRFLGQAVARWRLRKKVSTLKEDMSRAVDAVLRANSSIKKVRRESRRESLALSKAASRRVLLPQGPGLDALPEMDLSEENEEEEDGMTPPLAGDADGGGAAGAGVELSPRRLSTGRGSLTGMSKLRNIFSPPEEYSQLDTEDGERERERERAGAGAGGGRQRKSAAHAAHWNPLALKKEEDTKNNNTILDLEDILNATKQYKKPDAGPAGGGGGGNRRRLDTSDTVDDGDPDDWGDIDLAKQTSADLQFKMQGYLGKLKSDNILKAGTGNHFQRRYFVLNNENLLLYYSSMSDITEHVGASKGIIDLKAARDLRAGAAPGPGSLAITFLDRDRLVSLQAYTEPEAREWVAALREAVSAPAPGSAAAAVSALEAGEGAGGEGEAARRSSYVAPLVATRRSSTARRRSSAACAGAGAGAERRPTRKGELMLKGAFFWQELWFVLTDRGELAWHQGDPALPLSAKKGSLLLSDVLSVEQQGGGGGGGGEGGDPACFDVCLKGSTRALMAGSAQQAREWVADIAAWLADPGAGAGAGAGGASDSNSNCNDNRNSSGSRNSSDNIYNINSNRPSEPMLGAASAGGSSAGLGGGGVGAPLASRVAKRGVLYKKNALYWQRRWFELAGGELAWYNSAEDALAGGRLRKAGVCVAAVLSVDLHTAEALRLDVNVKGRTYELKAESEAEAKAWRAAIDSWMGPEEEEAAAAAPAPAESPRVSLYSIYGSEGGAWAGAGGAGVGATLFLHSNPMAAARAPRTAPPPPPPPPPASNIYMPGPAAAAAPQQRGSAGDRTGAGSDAATTADATTTGVDTADTTATATATTDATAQQKSGWVQKRNKMYWQTRWLELLPSGELNWYLSDQDAAAAAADATATATLTIATTATAAATAAAAARASRRKGTLSMSSVASVAASVSEQDAFSLEAGGRTYELKAESRAERDLWCAALTAAAAAAGAGAGAGDPSISSPQAPPSAPSSVPPSAAAAAAPAGGGTAGGAQQKSGWVQKRNKMYWQTRWLELLPSGELNWYLSDQDAAATAAAAAAATKSRRKGTLSMAAVASVAASVSEQDAFSLEAGGRTYELKAESRAERDLWCAALTAAAAAAGAGAGAGDSSLSSPPGPPPAAASAAAQQRDGMSPAAAPAWGGTRDASATTAATATATATTDATAQQKSGWVQKRNKMYWQTRWLELLPSGELNWYLSDQDAAAAAADAAAATKSRRKGTLSMAAVASVAASVSEQDAFSLEAGGRVYSLRARSGAERDLWCAALAAASGTAPTPAPIPAPAPAPVSIPVSTPVAVAASVASPAAATDIVVANDDVDAGVGVNANADVAANANATNADAAVADVGAVAVAERQAAESSRRITRVGADGGEDTSLGASEDGGNAGGRGAGGGAGQGRVRQLSVYAMDARKASLTPGGGGGGGVIGMRSDEGACADAVPPRAQRRCSAVLLAEGRTHTHTPADTHTYTPIDTPSTAQQATPTHTHTQRLPQRTKRASAVFSAVFLPEAPASTDAAAASTTTDTDTITSTVSAVAATVAVPVSDKQGWLKKKGGLGNRSWQKRWFVLAAGGDSPGGGAGGAEMLWFSAEPARVSGRPRREDRGCKGSLRMADVLCVEWAGAGADSALFSLTVRGRAYELQAGSRAEALEWHSAVADAMAAAVAGAGGARG
jgi:hypothetical protein